MILDSTCSQGRKWPDYADIRLDVRKDARPDIQASACWLPFRSQVFSKIYCDPPHIGYPGKETWAKNGIVANRFGFWKSWADWYYFLDRTNIEFERVLQPNGTLYYKILDGLGGGSVKLKHLVRLTNFKVKTDRIERSKGPVRRSPIHYLTYKIKIKRVSDREKKGPARQGPDRVKRVQVVS